LPFVLKRCTNEAVSGSLLREHLAMQLNRREELETTLMIMMRIS
jgi:hypothetical protein